MVCFLKQKNRKNGQKVGKPQKILSWKYIVFDNLIGSEIQNIFGHK